MDQSKDNIQAEVRQDATNWFEYVESRLYDFEYDIWMAQENLLTVRRAVQKIRSALPANGGAYLRGDNDQARRAHTDNTLDHDRAHAQELDLAESSESNGLVSELMEASTSNPNEITTHVPEHRRSTASDTNAPDADVGACGVTGCVAHIQQWQSAVLMNSAKRAGLAKGGSEKPRIGLRRSPRRHRQT
jgi:hypothetical protein